MIFSQVFKDFLKENEGCNLLRYTLKAVTEGSYCFDFSKISYVDVVNGTLVTLASNRTIKHFDSGAIDYSNFQEISCGKFFRKILTSEGIGEFDCELETAHLLFNLYFNQSKLDFVISRNFHKIYDCIKKGANNSVLYQSCMNNKDESYFQLYEEIPQCQIIAAYSDKKLVARAILWEIEGTFYVDRIYSISPLVEKLFIEYTKEQKYIRKYHQSYNYKIFWVDHEDNHFAKNIKIPVNLNKVYRFPYVDTFTYFNRDESFLHNGGFEAHRSLTYTDGGNESVGSGIIGELDNIQYCKASDDWGTDFSEVTGGKFEGQSVLTKNTIRVDGALYHKKDPELILYTDISLPGYHADYLVKSTLRGAKLVYVKRKKTYIDYEDFKIKIRYEAEHIFSKSTLHSFLNIYPGQEWQSLVEITE